MNDIPKTHFTLISGSATWGHKFPEDFGEPGVRLLEESMCFETPWGASENWKIFEMDGSATIDRKSRLVLNVFAHGWEPERINHGAHQKVFWILKQAGVKKILADSTCGSLNRAIQPRDYVIANDCIQPNQTEYSVLPGRFETINRGKQLFCPDMGKTLEGVARDLWPTRGRVYGQATNLTTGFVWGPRWETGSEAASTRLMGCDYINQSITPEATNAREIGACFISGSYVVNYVDGVIPGVWGEMDSIHKDLGLIAGRISLRTVGNIKLSDECGCQQYHTPRPAKYKTAIQENRQ
jgi:5'-methylthioadenosine phosphorylase